MLENNYNPERQNLINSIKGVESQLIEIENLERRAQQSIYNSECAIDQAVADISIDNLPPYHVLEEKLRAAVTKARELGLGEDSYIKSIGAMAFS